MFKKVEPPDELTRGSSEPYPEGLDERLKVAVVVHSDI
jgi:hypothetical protein